MIRAADLLGWTSAGSSSSPDHWTSPQWWVSSETKLEVKTASQGLNHRECMGKLLWGLGGDPDQKCHPKITLFEVLLTGLAAALRISLEPMQPILRSCRKTHFDPPTVLHSLTSSHLEQVCIYSIHVWSQRHKIGISHSKFYSLCYTGKWTGWHSNSEMLKASCRNYICWSCYSCV